ncbi:MAG TPA: hypothetical protein VF175_18155 [Lacipirellula sp.]
MLEELRWKTSVSATCLHTAVCRARGMEAADAALAAAVTPAADALIVELNAAGWPTPAVLEELTSLAAEIDNNRELVSRVIARLRLSIADVAFPVRVAGAIADLEAAVRRTQPQLAEELPARIRPIREQWEARAPGMLIEIARLTDPMIVPQAAEIVLVSPYVGGHGLAHAAQNRVTLEAVLFNPLPKLPEVVRLAWLISQLNADLPMLTDVLPARRSLAAMKLAMIAPVLAAAEAVELGQCDEAAVTGALRAWQPQSNAEQTAATIWSWWQAWMEHPTRWPVAVAALEQMLTKDI